MSVTIVDDDIVQPRRFQSMCGTDSCWNCDSDYGQHDEGYCPGMDDDDHPFDGVEPGLGRVTYFGSDDE